MRVVFTMIQRKLHAGVQKFTPSKKLIAFSGQWLSLFLKVDKCVSNLPATNITLGKHKVLQSLIENFFVPRKTSVSRENFRHYTCVNFSQHIYYIVMRLTLFEKDLFKLCYRERCLRYVNRITENVDLYISPELLVSFKDERTLIVFVD